MDLAGIIERIEVGILIQDASTKILFANQEARAVLGLDDEQLLDRNAHDSRWDVIHPDGAPFAPEDRPVPVAIRERRQVRGVLMGVYRPRFDDRVWIIVNALPAYNDDGSVKEVLCTFTNVSHEHAGKRELQALSLALAEAVEARTAELSSTLEALKESESSYRAVILAMAEGVAIHAADGSIRAANPAAEQILGLTLAQLQRRHPVDPAWRLTKGDGSPLAADEIPSEITRTTGVACRNVSLRVERGNGERAWLSVNTDPIRLSSAEKPRGVVATFTDVTAERIALDEIEASRSTVQRFMQAVPGVLFESVNAPGRAEQVRFVSPQVRDVFGVEEAEVLRSAESLFRHVHPDDVARVRNERREALEQPRQLDLELRVRGQGEGWQWLRLRSSLPEQTTQGLVTRNIVLDVTEQRRMAQSLRDAQRQEAMGVLAAGIAHNFNNMLAVILPSLERLRTELGGELVEEAEDSYQAASQAAELVRQLMLLARSETSAHVRAVDLCDLTREVVQMCNRTFERRISIVVDLPNEAVPVRGRRSELQQALLNLCINARDAVERSPQPRIEVTLRREGSRAVLRTTDNGVGMSSETQRRLGEPFFTTKAPGKGTGLGMASAVGIARELGGTLTWTSTVGQGSQFLLSLPIATDEGVISLRPTAPEEAELLAGQRVLVVDDEPLVLRSVERHLRAMGADVTTAGSGKEALETLAVRTDVTLVLLDLSMPAMHGEEVLRRIRAQHDTLPIFILSGWVPDPEALSAATGVIAKPFSYETLRAALLPHLGVLPNVAVAPSA